MRTSVDMPMSDMGEVPSGHDAWEAINAGLDLMSRLQKVASLHQDGGRSQAYLPGSGHYGWLEHACTTCGDFGEYGVEWPCDTLKAIKGEL